MIWYLSPEFCLIHLTDRIEVMYNERMIAFVEFTDDAKIRAISVDTQYRRRGIATYLIDLVERRTGIIPTPIPPVSELGRLLLKHEHNISQV